MMESTSMQFNIIFSDSIDNMQYDDAPVPMTIDNNGSNSSLGNRLLDISAAQICSNAINWGVIAFMILIPFSLLVALGYGEAALRIAFFTRLGTSANDYNSWPFSFEDEGRHSSSSYNYYVSTTRHINQFKPIFTNKVSNRTKGSKHRYCRGHHW